MFNALRRYWNRRKFARACRTGNSDAALVASRALLGDELDEYQLHNDVGVALLDAKQVDEAERCLRRSIELHEDTFNVNNLGRVLLTQGRFEEASEAFRRAAQLDPSDPKPRYNLTVLLREKGDAEAAAAALEQFVSEFPDHAGGQNDLGLILEDRGDTAGALAAFLRAVELSPHYVPACWNSIRLLCDAGEYPQTRPLLDRLAAAGKIVHVRANEERLEIAIDGELVYSSPINRSSSDQAAAD